MRAWLTGSSCVAVLLVGIISTVPEVRADHRPRATPSATPTVGSPLLQPAIDLGAAQEIALEGQGGAHVTEVDLDGNAGLLTYHITLDNGIDLQIDATTGEILGTERDVHPGDDISRRSDDVAVTRQGGDDIGATATHRGRHDGNDRSERRGDRDDKDKLTRRGHHDRDDNRVRRGHHARLGDKPMEPASTRIVPGDPCQCGVSSPRR